MFNFRVRSGALAIAITVALALHGCSTARKVPCIDSDKLPAAAFKALSPRTIRIEVKNTRNINAQAGNTAEVEKAVLDAVSGSVVRGGMTVNLKSKNKFALVVQDYEDGDPDQECVKIT